MVPFPHNYNQNFPTSRTTILGTRYLMDKDLCSPLLGKAILCLSAPTRMDLGPGIFPYQVINSLLSLCQVYQLVWDYLLLFNAQCALLFCLITCIIWHLANSTAISTLHVENKGSFHCNT